MNTHTIRIRPELLFVLGQIVLGGFLLWCLIRIPHYFFSLDQGGVSNYGTEPATKLLYALGFGAATLGTLLAAVTLPRGTSHRLQLRGGLLVLAALFLAVLLSTFSYKLNDTLRRLHDDVSIVLFAYMLVLALWLRFAAVRDAATKRAFLVFLVGIVVGALTLLGYLHVLFSVQIVCGIAFASILSHGIATLHKNMH